MLLGRVMAEVLYRVALVSLLVPALIPAALLDPLAERAARAVYRLNGRRARQLRANLRIVLGPNAESAAVDEAAREAYASYGRYMAEYFTMAWPDFWRRRSRLVADDVQPLESAISRGRGVVLFGSHGGNWDLAAAECARRYGAFHSAGESVQPMWLGKLISSVRRRGGMELYDESVAGRPLLRALRDGQVVGLVADRVVIGNGVEVELCGLRAQVPRGPVTLAIMTGAPLVPTLIRRDSGGDVRVEFWPPVDLSDLGRSPSDVATGAQRMADQLSELIRLSYRSWYGLQPIWAEARV